MQTRKYLKSPEAAIFLGVTIHQLFRWRKTGKGPAFVLLNSTPNDLPGKSFRRAAYPIDALEDFRDGNLFVPKQLDPGQIVDESDYQEISDKTWEIIHKWMSENIPENMETREFFNAVFYMSYSGRPFNLIPSIYGTPKSIKGRLFNFTNLGVWPDLINALGEFPYRLATQLIIIGPKGKFALCGEANEKKEVIQKYFHYYAHRKTVGKIKMRDVNGYHAIKAYWDKKLNRDPSEYPLEGRAKKV